MPNMSSSDSSPMRYGSGSDSDLNFVGTAADPTAFTAEISNKMRVPRQIRVGESGDDVNTGWGRPSLGSSSDKYEMRVPDRIMVTGQDQHFGSKALPRELQLESNSMPLPTDPVAIRIQTPPRQITLLNSRPESYMSTDPEDDDTLIVENDRARFGNDRAEPPINGTVMMYQERNRLSLSQKSKLDSSLLNGNGDSSEEVVHLREQLSRMNRRVLALEEDSTDRKERERYMVMVSLLYVAFKAVSWLFRSGNHHH